MLGRCLTRCVAATGGLQALLDPCELSYSARDHDSQTYLFRTADRVSCALSCS